jgi:hypothetical protein
VHGVGGMCARFFRSLKALWDADARVDSLGRHYIKTREGTAQTVFLKAEPRAARPGKSSPWRRKWPI